MPRTRLRRTVALLASAAVCLAVAGEAPAFASAEPRAVLPPAGAGTASCYPGGMPADTSLSDPKVSLGAVGAYASAECGDRYGQVLAANAATAGALPKVKRSTASFVGTNSAYFTMQDDLYDWHVSEQPRKLGATINTTCTPANAWDAIQTAAVAADPSYNPGKPPKYVINQCANATYIDSLLYGDRGLFTGKERKKLLRTVPSQKTVNGVSTTVLSWARGYLLLKYGNKCADCGVPGTSEYRAVIDAGSSGTRLSLYRVRYKPSGYPKVIWKQTLDRDDAENGIDDYANPDPAERPGTGNVNTDVINPLLEMLTAGYLTAHPLPARSTLMVDVLATAGMREAQAKWGTPAVDALYSQIRANLESPQSPANTGLAAVSSHSTYAAGLVRTINGNTQEGVWTWVNLNDYYCNFFGNPKGKVRKACRGVPGGNLGAVEVGGASAQISFPVAAKTAKGHRNLHQVTLNHRDLRIFNKTYLGLGQDSARRSMAALSQ